MRNYVKVSAEKILKEQREHRLYNKINVYLKDPLPENINLPVVLRSIEEKVPEHLAYLIDSIFIGEFNIFKEKHVNALYKDAAIYLSNAQSDNEDMIDDIIHEFAHSVEELAPDEIYADGKVEFEFFGKRKRLKSLLSSEGYDINKYDFNNLNYSDKFDSFLYKEIGYPTLTSLTIGLFVSPYGATSLREYFANCFEEYFLRGPEQMKHICPEVFEKLELIANYEAR